NGVVYIGSDDRHLYAFDAAGSTNCSGVPKICAPLWSAATDGRVVASPTVVNGVVYIGSQENRFYAFDAAGNINCSGTPKTCTPLWTATTGNMVFSSAAVANNVVYITSADSVVNSSAKLYAFDATGTTNCSGTPKTCAPLWTASMNNLALSSPAVVDGVVY